MKGQPEIIDALNHALAEELSAVNQYILHAEMCENWGYGKLHDLIKKRAIQEMKHAEKLVTRILFLEGRPEVGTLNALHIGETVEKQLRYDLTAETGAVATYNAAIRLAADKLDGGTRELLEAILKDEEEHVDWLETQIELLGQIGLPNYLLAQV